MMTFLLIVLALAAAGLITELIAASTAPLGYQDEKGFHYGIERPVLTEELERGNPS